MINKIKTIISKPKARVYIYITIIVGVTLAVYYPSFWHLLRGEMYTFFMDSMGKTSAVSLVENYYNYEMVRVFDAGDSLAFRPLLFGMVGIQAGLFGANYIWWHITAFVFHLIATLCLFRLLWKIRPSVITLLLTIFFSTSFMIMATILYEQISSYALVAALIMTSMYYVHCGTRSGRTKHLILAAISIMVACFIYEVGFVMTVLLIGYCWLERKNHVFKWKRWVLAFTAVICIYVSCYTVETLLNPTDTTERDFNRIVSISNINPILSNGNRLTTYWLTQTLRSTRFNVEVDSNFRANPINIKPTVQEWIIYREEGKLLTSEVTSGNTPIILTILNWAAIVLLVSAFFFKPNGLKQKVSNQFLLLATISPFVIAGANALYRGSTHTRDYFMSDANYNMYLWMCLFIIGIYCFLSLKKFSKLHIGIIATSILIFISLGLPITYRLNQEVKDDGEPIRAYFEEIDEFISMRRPEDERDFSFNATINSSDQEDRLEVLLWKGLSWEESFTPYYFTMTEILYWRYWDNENPKYTLIYHSEEKELEVIKNE